MILKNYLEAQGAILFRWRSFLPFAILPFAVLAGLASSEFPDGHTDLAGHLYDLACMLVSFLGLAIRGYTVASAAPRTSGRNTREQRADSLNTTGIYSIMRNPLYFANFLMLLGMLLFIKEWWLVVMATLAFIMYYERIVLAEEQYLVSKFGAAYLAWAERTPVMFPNFRLWVKPDRGFSVKTLLRREYNGFFLIIAGFYVLEWCDRLLFYKSTFASFTLAEAPGMYWTGFFLGGTVVFLVLRTLKKHTAFLDDSN